MSFPREGINVDYFGALVRKTLLNPLFTLPVAVGRAATLPPSPSVANLAWVLRLKKAGPLVYTAAALGLALRFNRLLKWGFNNN